MESGEGGAGVEPTSWLVGPRPHGRLGREVLEERLHNLLSSNNVAVLATVGPSGAHATPVRYYHRDLTLFFTANPRSPKMRNIALDSRVSLGIAAPLVGPASSRGCQIFGTAEVALAGEAGYADAMRTYRWQLDAAETGRSVTEPSAAAVVRVAPRKIVYTEHWLRRRGINPRQVWRPEPAGTPSSSGGPATGEQSGIAGVGAQPGSGVEGSAGRHLGPRPWLVMVTGEPGSGKSSLGMHLAKRLRVPYLSRDDIRWGMLATSRPWSGQPTDTSGRDAARETFIDVVERAAGQGVSGVPEFIIFRDNPDHFRRLMATADCLVAVTNCSESEQRAVARDRADPLLADPTFLAALGHSSIDSFLQVGVRERQAVRGRMLSDFEDFGVPTLAVRTDEGYEPALDEIINWVTSNL